MKIDVKQVLRESADVYKSHFRHLIGASLIASLYSLLLESMSLYAMFKEYPALLAIFALTIVALLIVALFILPKNTMAIIVLINSFFTEKQLTYRESYRRTKGKYWVMAESLVPMTLLMILPVFAFRFVNLNSLSVSLFNAIYSAVISSIFYPIWPMIALETKSYQYLGKASKLIKGNFPAAFVLTLITTTLLTALRAVAAYFLNSYPIGLLISKIVYVIAYFFMFSFLNIVLVIVYRQLPKQNQTEE